MLILDLVWYVPSVWWRRRDIGRYARVRTTWPDYENYIVYQYFNDRFTVLPEGSRTQGIYGVANVGVEAVQEWLIKYECVSLP